MTGFLDTYNTKKGDYETAWDTRVATKHLADTVELSIERKKTANQAAVDAAAGTAAYSDTASITLQEKATSAKTEATT